MGKLIICIGIPASGKSTWANEYQKENPDIVIVTRDDIREEYNATGGGWSPDKEYFVVEEMKRRIILGLRTGKTVISADTNLNPKVRFSLANIALKCKAKWEAKIFNTPLDVCIERDSKREGHRRVGEEKIREYYQKFREIGGTNG